MKFTKKYFDKYDKEIKKLLKNIEVKRDWGLTKDQYGYWKITFYLGKDFTEDQAKKASQKIQKELKIGPKYYQRKPNKERDKFCIKTQKELGLSEKLRPHDIWRWIEIHHIHYTDYYKKKIKTSHNHLK